MKSLFVFQFNERFKGSQPCSKQREDTMRLIGGSRLDKFTRNVCGSRGSVPTHTRGANDVTGT